MNCRTGNETIWSNYGGKCNSCSTSCNCGGTCPKCEENCICGGICLMCKENCNCGGNCLKCEKNCNCGCPQCRGDDCNCGGNCLKCEENCKCGGNCPKCDKNCKCNSSMSNYLVDFRIFILLLVLVWQDKWKKNLPRISFFFTVPSFCVKPIAMIDGSWSFKQ